MRANKRSRRANGLSPRGLRQAANRCNNGIRCKISSMGVVSVLSRQVPAILSLARRPGRPDVLLLRVSADNGDTVSGVTLLVIQHARKPFGCEGMRTVLGAAEEDRAHDTKERERWPRCRRPSDWSPDIVVHYGVGDGM
jgi:hypothetical protein